MLEWVVRNYVCNLMDLHNREIIGSAAGEKKEAKLVEKVLLSIPYSLKDIKIFHSDRNSQSMSSPSLHKPIAPAGDTT